MQKERVLLPSEDQYQVPKEFREEILNAMKKQIPKDYQRMLTAIAQAEQEGLIREDAIMAAFEANKNSAARASGN